MNRRFPTTAWSLLEEAKSACGPDRSDAVNRFIVHYWRPIYYFIRARGYKAEAAEDLTQEFLLRVLEKDWLDRANPARGRFRSLLLKILARFLADRSEARAPRQWQFDQKVIPVSVLVTDSERSFEPPDNTTPEELFMKKWAQAMVDNVRTELETWCRERGRPDWHEIFDAHHFPASDKSHQTQDQLAKRFRCSRDQIRYAIECTNRKFGKLLRAAVAQQVGSEDEVEDEILRIEELLAK